MKPISILILFLMPVSHLLAQSGLSPDSALAALRNNYPQEKVFLQTDKSYYFPGETIWMKAWCTLDGAPTYLSRILYVDLVNSQGEVISKKMYKLDALGSTPADLEILPAVKSGNYTINAYTLWMLNFPQFVYHRNIYIYNPAGYQKSVSPAPGINLQFFPEGGELIAGAKSRVAFMATDKNGWPVSVQGMVADNTGKEQARFSTQHDGMGVLEMEVEAGKTYTATIDNQREQYKLPAVKEEGIGLRVENSNPNRAFVLLSRAEKNKEKYNQLKVVAQMYHQLVFKAELNFDEGQMAAPISKKNLPPGIMQITVFDARNNPLAERLVFVENYKLIAPAINTDTLNTKPRGKNQFSFLVNELNAATLSCLVTSDISGSTDNMEDNIASSFLLTTDLPGVINNPGYYFRNKEPQTLQHLDLLLMTRGWRRFEWKRILQNDYLTLTYPVESAISFSGKVTKSDRREPVKEGKVSFIIKGADSTSLLAEATLTDKGEFLLNNVNYMKSAAVAYMGTNSKKEAFVVDVKLNPSYIDSLHQSLYKPAIDLDTIDLASRKNALATYIDRHLMLTDTSAFKNAKILQGVVVTGKKVSKEDSLNREYAGGPFLMGKAIDPSGIKYARSIWQVIQQTVPGVTVEGNPFDPKVSFNRFGGLGNEDFSVNAGTSSDGSISNDIVMQTNGIAYYLNEVNVSKDIINTVSVEDVALIKVLKNEGAALGAAQGVIALYTKKGVAVSKQPFEKSYTVVKREGYAVVQQFYTSDYTLNPDVREADNRHTLYWNGRINPSKDGKYRFRFFNNDSGKQFRITIQGIDKDGQLIYGEQVIN